MNLLSREEFKRQVFDRDHGKCVICMGKAVDAHHIIDRSLFEDCGYYIDNGVSLCSIHHLQAEQTIISCSDLRKAAGVTNIVLPEHFDVDEKWDHWGNIITSQGQRLRGELFFNENVQKALRDGGILSSFLPYVKYPRTYHLPSSPNLQNDDRKHKDVRLLLSQPIIGTIKIDGENCTMYRDYIHARSLDSKHHPSRSMVKALHGRIAHEIPDGWRIAGENVYAMHSIHYKHLEDHFYVFSIWNEKNEALSWKDTLDYCDILGLKTVPVFYSEENIRGGDNERNSYYLDRIHRTFMDYVQDYPDEVEGYVLRVKDKIPYHMFKHYTGKYVRKNHVQTDEFWMEKPVVPNEIETGPLYTQQELKQIQDIRLKFPNEKDHYIISCSNFLQRVLLSENVQPCDTISLKYALLSEIKKAKEAVASHTDGWRDIREDDRLEVVSNLYKAIFCSMEELPLLISAPYKEIVAWRLKHGI